MPNRLGPTNRDLVRRLTVRLRESAPTLERVDLREAPRNTPAPDSGGRMLVQLISAGWGTSGYYGEDVLREAAATRRFASGLSMFLDHPSLSEEQERPERSVRDLAAVLTEDARWDDSRKALVAEAKALPTYRDLLGDKDFVEAVGLSIRAGGVAEYGQVGDRKGLIVREILEATSVDFVTKAGRGGKVLALLESARAQTALTEQVEPAPTPLREARTWGSWLESRLHLASTEFADNAYGDGRLTREERLTLSSAIGDALAAWIARVQADAPQLYERDIWSEPKALTESRRLRETSADQIRTALDAAVRAAYGGEDKWCWVRDYDPDRGLVWFEAGSDGESGTWQQAYTTDGEDAETVASLTGERSKVVAQTVYVPAPDVADLEESAQPAPAEDVTDGTAPAAPNPPLREEPSMSEDTTGPAPGTAGTAAPATPTVDTTQLREAEAAKTAAEQARDVALREAAEAKTELQRFRAVEAARPIAATVLAESGMPAAAQARVLAAVERRVPLTEAGALDEAAFKALVEAEATAEKTYLASLAEADGAGRVTGFGQPAQPAQAASHVPGTSWSTPATPVNTALVEAYKARGLSAEAALAAVRGRSI